MTAKNMQRTMDVRVGDRLRVQFREVQSDGRYKLVPAANLRDSTEVRVIGAHRCAPGRHPAGRPYSLIVESEDGRFAFGFFSGNVVQMRPRADW